MTPKTIDLDKTSITIDGLLKLLEAEGAVLLQNGDRVFLVSEVEAQKLTGKLIRSGERFTVRYMPKRKRKNAQPRIAGLHAGTSWVSDDFDDPLPDDFWLGEP